MLSCSLCCIGVSLPRFSLLLARLAVHGDNLGGALGARSAPSPGEGFWWLGSGFSCPGARRAPCWHRGPGHGSGRRWARRECVLEARGRRRTALKGAGREMELPLLPGHLHRKLQEIPRTADQLGHKLL